MIYNIENERIDWENAKKHILSRKVSSFFDVTSKVFKVYNNRLYFWVIENDYVALKNVCLESQIVFNVIKIECINL